MFYRFAVVSLSLAVFALPVATRPSAARAAAEVVGEGPITAVTVFPDRAEVRRSVAVAIPAGASTVLIENLPVGLIPQTLRVRGMADSSIVIGSVESKRHFAEGVVRAEEHRLNAELEGLQDQRRALQDRVAAARLQLDFLTALGRNVPQVANRELVEGRMSPDDWRQALEVLGQGAATAYQSIREADVETRKLDGRIRQVQNELSRVRTGRTATLTARINLESATPAEARLELSYQIGGASWRPLYDARLDTESGALQLVQYGEVRQGTGEDWSRAALTLSTARPAQTTSLPQLDAWFIDFVNLARMQENQLSSSELRNLQDAMQKSATVGGAGDQAPAGAALPEEAMVPASSSTARLVAGEFAAEYLIPGESAVPSDNEPHKFVIAERALETKLAVRTAPKIAPQAHLYGEIRFTGEAPWLPGPVAIFRDNAFVGTTGIGILRPDETFKLAFGVDDRVRVSYRLETGERSREGIINRDRRIERHYLIKVANHHARPMEITVLDQLPVARDERIDVELLRATTRPSERDFDDRKGVIAWTDPYEANQEREIRFAYAVTYPEGQTLPGF